MNDNPTTWPKKQLSAFLAALRFLTVFPVKWNADRDGEYFRQSLIFFPVIGLLIGLVGYLLTAGLLLLFPQPVVACLALCYLAFASGCLHLDGLTDSGDGLLSSRPRERAMEIMHDSRVGAMGVIVTVMVILAKLSALISIDSTHLALAVFFMPFAGRVAILCAMAVLPYARAEGGLGGLFYSTSLKRLALFAVLLLGVTLFVLASGRMFTVLLIAFFVFYLFNSWCKAKLGGATGDTLGANCELTEMAVALAFSASFSLGL